MLSCPVDPLMRKTAVIDVSTSGSALLQGCYLQEHQSPSTNDDKAIHSIEHREQIHPIEMRSSVEFREHTAPNTPAHQVTRRRKYAVCIFTSLFISWVSKSYNSFSFSFLLARRTAACCFVWYLTSSGYSGFQTVLQTLHSENAA